MESREKAAVFPATIAYQLCRTAINRAIDKRPHIFSEDLPSQFRQLLTKPAQTTGFLQGPITVVIDGLDECDSVPDQVKLLELILEAVKTGNMRFLIASRPEQHIHTFFYQRDISQHTWQVCLDEETFNTSQDIKIFLREEFARIRQARPEACLRLPNGEEWPGVRVVNHLTAESDSQFMFPILAIGFIDTPFFPPDKQLQLLLAAPPSGAFSALDALYHRILSRRPPAQLFQGEDALSDYEEVVMGILRVIMAWSGAPLSAAKIAVVLDKPVDVVQNIVRGPMRTLFRFHTSEPNSPITLCHKSLRDYLLDRKRSQEFFIPSAEEDDLFVAILSRHSASHPTHPNSHGILMDVLSFVCAIAPRDRSRSMACSLPDIAAFLEVDPTLVEHVVRTGPTNLLFDVWGDGVDLCTWSFKQFLKDSDRSGPYFMSYGRTDPLVIRALSRQLPSAPLYSESRDVVLDIMAVTTSLTSPRGSTTTCQLAALLKVDSTLIEHVVKFGAAKWLVKVDENGNIVVNNNWVTTFLHDGDRSGEFFVSDRRLDPIFTRILSQETPSDPSHSSSHDMLMGVLTAVLAFWEGRKIWEIASILGVDPVFVEGVVKFGPTNLLFNVDQDKVILITRSLSRFLGDSDRSGAFFISEGRMDALFIKTLSRRPPPDSSNPYSRDVLLDILAVTLESRSSFNHPSIRQIASFLEVDFTLVEHVVKFGTEKWTFTVDGDDRVAVSAFRLMDFLLDANRSEEVFISDRRLDPFFVQILSRQPPSDPFHSKASSHDIMLRIVAAIAAFEDESTIHKIASVVGVDPVFVEGVVDIGPTKVLFAVEESEVTLLWPSLKDFLQDANRSGSFFVPQRARTDALFINALSTTSLRVYPHSRGLLMDVLTVILMTDSPSLDLTLCRVAAFLDIDPGLIEGVVFGPTKDLFQVKNDRLSFSSPSLGPFLQDVDRAGDFCITEQRMDTVISRFLSRHTPSSDPAHSHTWDTLTRVLSVMAHSDVWSTWTVSLLAAFHDIDPMLIEGVVSIGPTRLLFRPFHFNRRMQGDVKASPASVLRPFLKDASRSGGSFVSDKSLDPFFTRILSSSSPPGASQSKSQDILKDVLALKLVTSLPFTLLSIAAALDIDPRLVDDIVKVAPARLLFSVDWVPDRLVALSTASLSNFLRDVERSGEFYISDVEIDALFIRILSLPPPSHFSYPHSRDVLFGVMMAILASPEPLTRFKIATLLDVEHSVVEGVFEIMPAKVLFNAHMCATEVQFSGPFLKPFLQDAERSGEFFIPPTRTLEDIPKPWLKRPSDSV